MFFATLYQTVEVFMLHKRERKKYWAENDLKNERKNEN